VDRAKAKDKIRVNDLLGRLKINPVVPEDRELGGVNLPRTKMTMNRPLPTKSLRRISSRICPLPVPSSLRKLKRAARSLFLYGEVMARRRCAKTARSAKISGILRVLPVSL